MTPQQILSPTGTTVSQPYGGHGPQGSPLALIQPRHKNRATYVQRWKVLRDRNKNLPMLDFNAKASGIPKKFQGAPSFSRSYTYDSMKLPSISTCSVVTGHSGKSVQSDGYRCKDKKQLQEHSGASDYTDIAVHHDFQGLNGGLSKSLQSLDERSESGDKALSSKHRYERISYTKQITNRRRNNRWLQKEPTLLNKDKTVLVPEKTVVTSDRVTNKDNGERQYVYVKNHRKEKQSFPQVFNALRRETEIRGKREKNPYDFVNTYPCQPNDTIPFLDVRSIPTTITLTPDDVTIRTPPSTGVCSPKSTLTVSSSMKPTNISVHDNDLVACE